MKTISKKQQRLNRRNQQLQSTSQSSGLEPPSINTPEPPIKTHRPPQPSKPKRRPLRRFHLFPTLPKDLRLLIWEHTFPPSIKHHICLIHCDTGKKWTIFIPAGQTPPIVPLAWVSSPEESMSVETDDDEVYEFPVGLSVNREIRAFVMGRYEQLNVWERYRSWRAESWGWRRVWFLRDRDLIVVGTGRWRGVEREREGFYNMRGGLIGGSVGVRRVWVVVEEKAKDGDEYGARSVEEKKKEEGERYEKQILKVLKVFEGVVEVGLVNRGSSREFGWRSRVVVVTAKKGSGGDWFIGEERIVCGVSESV